MSNMTLREGIATAMIIFCGIGEIASVVLAIHNKDWTILFLMGGGTFLVTFIIFLWALKINPFKKRN